MCQWPRWDHRRTWGEGKKEGFLLNSAHTPLPHVSRRHLTHKKEESPGCGHKVQFFRVNNSGKRERQKCSSSKKEGAEKVGVGSIDRIYYMENFCIASAATERLCLFYCRKNLRRRGKNRGVCNFFASLSLSLSLSHESGIPGIQKILRIRKMRREEGQLFERGPNRQSKKPTFLLFFHPGFLAKWIKQGLYSRPDLSPDWVFDPKTVTHTQCLRK